MHQNTKLTKIIVFAITICCFGIHELSSQNIVNNGDFESGTSNWTFSVNDTETGTTIEVIGGDEAISGDSTLKFSHPPKGNKGMWRVSAKNEVLLEQGYIYELRYKAHSNIDKWTGAVVRPTEVLAKYQFTYRSPIEYKSLFFKWDEPDATQELTFWVGYNGEEADAQVAYNFYLDDVQLIKREAIEPSEVNIVDEMISLCQGSVKKINAQMLPVEAIPSFEWYSRDNSVVKVEDGELTGEGEGETYVIAISSFYPDYADSILVKVSPDIAFNGNVEEGDTLWSFVINDSEVDSEIGVNGDMVLNGDSSIVLKHAAAGNKGMWRSQARYAFQADSGYTYKVYYTAKSSMVKWTGFVQRPGKAFNDSYFNTSTEAEEYGPFTFVWNQASGEQQLYWWIGYNGEEAETTPAYDFMIDNVRIVKMPNVDAEGISIDHEDQNIGTGDKLMLSASISPEGAEPLFNWISRDEAVVTVNNDGELNGKGEGSTYVVVEAKAYPEFKDSIMVNVAPDIAHNGNVEMGDTLWSFVMNESEVDSEIGVNGEMALSGDSSIVLKHAAAGNKGMWRSQARYAFQADSGYTYKVYYTAKSSMEKWTGFVQRPGKAFHDAYFNTSTDAEEYGPFTFLWNQASGEQQLYWWIGYNGEEAETTPAYDFIIDDIRIVKMPNVDAEGISIDQEDQSIGTGDKLMLSASISPEGAEPLFNWISRDEAVVTVDNEGELNGKGEGSIYVVVEAKAYPEFKDSILVNVAPDIAYNGNVEEGDTLWSFVMNESEVDSEIGVNGEMALSSDSSIVLKHAAAGNKGMWRSQARYTFQADSGYMYKVYYTAKSSMDKWTGFVQRPGKAFSDSYFNTTTEAEEYGPFTFVWNQASGEQQLYWWIGYNGEEAETAPAYDFMIDEVRLVKMPMVEMTGMEISEENISMKGDEEYVIHPVITPSNASMTGIEWNSQYDSIAWVNEQGQIMTNNPGETWLYAQAVPWGLKDSVLLTVDEVPLSGISFVDSEFTINADETIELDLVFDPSKPANSSIDWYSTNNTIAKVDDNGVVTGMSGGVVQIFAISDFRGFQTMAKVEVISEYTALQGISLNINEETIEMGGAPASLQVIYDPPTATEKGINWTSEDESVATVDSTGKVTAVGNGTVQITAESVEGGYIATASIRVITRVRKVSLNTRTETLAIGETFQLVATISPETASNQNLTWESVDENVVSVDNTGMVTAVGEGETEVSVTTEDKGLKISANFTVIPTSIENFKSVGIKLYPVPADQQIIIESINKRYINQVDIYDLSGHVIKSTKVNAERSILEVGSMNSGVYILKASFNDGSISRLSFIKE